MTGTQFLPTHAVLVGTVAGWGTSLVRRLCAAVVGAAVVAGLLGWLVPWGLTVEWLAAICGLVLASSFVGGLRRDLRAVGQLSISLSPARRVVLRGSWRVREHELTEVVAVQVWCDCGASRRSVAPHRDGMEVLLRGGRSVRVVSGTALPPDVAMTLSEALPGVRVVDWGEIDAILA